MWRNYSHTSWQQKTNVNILKVSWAVWYSCLCSSHKLCYFERTVNPHHIFSYIENKYLLKTVIEFSYLFIRHRNRNLFALDVYEIIGHDLNKWYCFKIFRSCYDYCSTWSTCQYDFWYNTCHIKIKEKRYLLCFPKQSHNGWTCWLYLFW